MTPTRLYLVRHGATALTTEDKFSGDIGVELSDDGRWQAAKLGERLAKEGIAAVYSSPLSRAVDTAHLIVDRPAGLPTHWASISPAFATQFGRCLVAFAGEPASGTLRCRDLEAAARLPKLPALSRLMSPSARNLNAN